MWLTAAVFKAGSTGIASGYPKPVVFITAATRVERKLITFGSIVKYCSLSSKLRASPLPVLASAELAHVMTVCWSRHWQY